jgi:hypothetical protein
MNRHSNTPSQSQSNINPPNIDRTAYSVPPALHNAPISQANNLNPQSERSKRLARELEDFVDRGLQGILAHERGDEGAPTFEAAVEVQIQIARMFRQVSESLSTNRD